MITEYIAQLAGKRAQDSIDHYRKILGNMDRDLEAGLPLSTAAEIEAWINSGRRSKGTRAHYRVIANGFFEYATDPRHGLLDFNPVALIDQLRVPRRKKKVMTVDMARRIMAAAADPYRFWYLLAYHAGMRCIELERIQRDHITRDEIFIVGKGDVERTVPTHPLIWTAVQPMRGQLVRLRDGSPAGKAAISRTGNYHMQVTLRMGRLAHMHGLRGLFATGAYEANGRDIIAVQDLLGHASVTTTQTYIEASAEAKRRGVTGLPEVA